MKVDETSIAIIKQLRDGRKPFKRIAEELGLSENTVRLRINKLQEEGVLDIVGLVNPEMIPRLRLVMIGVKLKTTDMFKKGEEFSKLRGVVSVSVVTGRYDLMLLVLFDRGFGLQEFYSQEVARLEGVQSMETFVIYKGFNLKIPYL
jgi:Lrp/AsnC family transcriptional regulator for asnA, asnC and gidA